MGIEPTIEHRRHGRWYVIGLGGEIDLATAPALETAIAEWDGSGDLCIDLSAVSFIDSTGLRALISGSHAAEDHDSSFCLVAPEGPVTKLLEITGLDDAWNVFASPADLGD